MKTHVVLDFHYHEDEGQQCFDGTKVECEEFAAKQTPHFMYKVVPMTEDEIDAHPDNIKSQDAQTTEIPNADNLSSVAPTWYTPDKMFWNGSISNNHRLESI